MEPLPNKIDLALLIWDKGIFLATTSDGERISLYRYNKKLYVIRYTSENQIDNVEEVDAAQARNLFKKSNF